MGLQVVSVGCAAPGLNALGKSVGPDEFIDVLETVYANGSERRLGMLEKAVAKRVARKAANGTGIQKRDLLIADEVGLKATYLAALSLQEALKSISMTPGELDGIVFCSNTPDCVHPSNGLIIADLFGINLIDKKYATVDIACISVEEAITTYASNWIQTGACKTIAIIAGDVNSRLRLPLNDRESYLFGDQFVTIILKKSDEGGVFSTGVSADTAMAKSFVHRCSYSADSVPLAINQLCGAANDRGLGTLGIWESQLWPWLLNKVVEEAQISIDEKTVVIGPQATKKVHEEGLSNYRNRTKHDIEKNVLVPSSYMHGNTGAAAFPLAFYEGRKSGKIRSDTKVIMIFAGVGGMFGSLVIDPSAKETNRALKLKIDSEFPNSVNLIRQRANEFKTAVPHFRESLYFRLNPKTELTNANFDLFGKYLSQINVMLSSAVQTDKPADNTIYEVSKT